MVLQHGIKGWRESKADEGGRRPMGDLRGFSARHGQALRDGVRDGIPIGLGYLAVSFSLGIAARNVGLDPLQGLLASLLNNASAGEYAAFTLMAASGTLLEMAVVTLVANARYLLMSCALSQRFAPGTPAIHRILVGFDLTDEIFGIAVARDGFVDPYYSYGAMIPALPCWAGGTALGIVVGNIMPPRVVSALSVALFGMFLAIIVPPARRNRAVGAFVLLSFLASWAFTWAPLVSAWSGGTRTIVLTVALSSLAALLFPVAEGDDAIVSEGAAGAEGAPRPRQTSPPDHGPRPRCPGGCRCRLARTSTSRSWRLSRCSSACFPSPSSGGRSPIASCGRSSSTCPTSPLR